VLIEIEAGRGNAEALEQLGRELHTLKGESRMFGLAEIADVVHAAETIVVLAEGAMPAPGDCTRVIAGLDVITRFLRAAACPRRVWHFRCATALRGRRNGLRSQRSAQERRRTRWSR